MQRLQHGRAAHSRFFSVPAADAGSSAMRLPLCAVVAVGQVETMVDPQDWLAAAPKKKNLVSKKKNLVRVLQGCLGLALVAE